MHNLPIEYRKPRCFALLSCMLEPLRSGDAEFREWMLNAKYRLAHNGRVIYLEKVLNEYLGIPGYNPNDHEATKQVWIGDGNAPDREYIFLDAENQPRYLGTLYLSTESEYLALYSDFIVNIPAGVAFEEVEVNALVDYYKLAGKFHTINIY